MPTRGVSHRVHPVRTRLIRSSVLAAALLPLTAAAATANAPVRERLITTRAIQGDVTAGYGYVAWLEGAGAGHRRLVVVRPDGSRRSARLTGNVSIDNVVLRPR